MSGYELCAVELCASARKAGFRVPPVPARLFFHLGAAQVFTRLLGSCFRAVGYAGHGHLRVWLVACRPVHGLRVTVGTDRHLSRSAMSVVGIGAEVRPARLNRHA